MPSEKSRYIFGKVSPTADFDRGEVLAVLESLGSGAIAERLWQRSETEVSLRRQLGAMVLRSRVSNCVSLGRGRPYTSFLSCESYASSKPTGAKAILAGRFFWLKWF